MASMTDALRAAFALTDDDLAHNRRGELSPAQAARATKATGDDATFMAGFAVLFAIVMYGVLWFIWDSGAFDRMSGGGGLVIAIAGGFPTAAIAWAIWTWVVHRRSRGATQVAVAEGAVETNTRRYRGVALHQVLIDGEAFDVTPEAQAAIGALSHARLYYVPVSRVVVGAEAIDAE